jgi:hypothetical protein
MLSDNIMDYHVVSQGKTTIPGVDDGEECELTDVRTSPYCFCLFFNPARSPHYLVVTIWTRDHPLFVQTSWTRCRLLSKFPVLQLKEYKHTVLQVIP